jgi:hypothetical protein
VLIVDEASRVRDELWATISPMLAAAPAAQQILLSTPAGASGSSTAPRVEIVRVFRVLAKNPQKTPAGKGLEAARPFVVWASDPARSPSVGSPIGQTAAAVLGMPTLMLPTCELKEAVRLVTGG